MTALGLLQVILVVLKIVGVLTCSWWLVFIPAYIVIVTVVLAIVLFATFLAFAG